MEIFYSDQVFDGLVRLPAEETAHCMRVLRHRPGDEIDVIDGRGMLYHCVLQEEEAAGAAGRGKGGEPRHGKSEELRRGKSEELRRSRGEEQTAVARIVGSEAGWGSHPYHLTLAVCPTKNPDRYEWMAEKVTEIGVDTLAPVIGERSERRVLKTDRLHRILLSATKQSLKGAIPELLEPQTVMEFIASMVEVKGEDACGAPGAVRETGGAANDAPGAVHELRLIAYCSDEVKPRAFIMDLLAQMAGKPAITAKDAATPSRPLATPKKTPEEKPRVTVLIGPEGDFSPAEVQAAMAAGFVPVSLGSSRLRTETAAITSAEAVYLSFHAPANGKACFTNT